MPRIIQTCREPIPKDGVLIPSAYLRNDIAAARVVDEARRRAKYMLRQAGEDAGHIRMQAFQEGYAAGFSVLANAVISSVDQHAQMAERIWSRLSEQMRHVLRASLNEPEVLVTALEQALRTCVPPTAADTIIEVWLPESWQACEAILSERLAAQCEERIRIFRWEQSRVLVRSGEHVIEFAPDEFVNHAIEMQRPLLASLGMDGQSIATLCQRQISALLDASAGRTGAQSREIQGAAI